MRIEIRPATAAQRSKFLIEASDAAILVQINGKYAAWVDDYGTAHLFTANLHEFRSTKKQIEDLVHQWAGIATALDSGTGPEEPEEDDFCDGCGEPFGGYDGRYHKHCGWAVVAAWRTGGLPSRSPVW